MRALSYVWRVDTDNRQLTFYLKLQIIKNNKFRISCSIVNDNNISLKCLQELILQIQDTV